MNKVPRFVWTLLLCLVCVVVTAACCLMIGSDKATSDKYQEVITSIQNNSVDAAEAVELEDAAAQAMVASLNDSWSYYLNKEEYEEYKLNKANEFIGIGVTTEFNGKYGYLGVTSVVSGSPAAQAQIEIGNLITSVNNTDVASFSPADLEGYLKSFGEEEFSLGLMNSQGGTRSVKLRCKVIYMPPVTWEMQEGNVGYIRISNFDTGCSAYLKDAITDLQYNKAKALVLDVRKNSGGEVAELQAALDYLLPKGDMFICKDKNGKETMYSSDSNYVNIPMVLMTTAETENEAEMFAYVMQAFGAATVVGERTSGNGHSQIVLPLSDGSAVRVSKYSFLNSDRKTLQTLGGVMPDIRSKSIADSSLDVIYEAAMDAAQLMN